MINIGEGVALAMVSIVTAVSLLLVFATIVRKIRRDRRTQISRDRHRALTLSMDQYRSEPSDQLAQELSRNLLIELRSTTGRRSLIAYLPRCESEEVDLLGSLASQSGGCDVLIKAARSRRGALRGSGILLLGLLRRPQVVTLETDALSDRDRDVRLVGVRVLSLLPPSVGVPPLLSALRADTIPAARVVERLAALAPATCSLQRWKTASPPRRTARYLSIAPTNGWGQEWRMPCS